jgi:DNA topoisomerase VI subunit B
VAEKEAVCGRVIARGELKKQPAEFFRGEMVIKPQTEQEMITPSGKDTPFMVIFKDLPSKAKDFKYEILEAPNL